jgi:nitrite reductase/ring-hydroxylating ferredoxin subunit
VEAGLKLFVLAELKPGQSLRFGLGAVAGRFGPVELEGFALRTAAGEVRAYLNVCPHRAQPVDLGDGRLYLPSGEIECSAHGARFDPASGACTGGPCAGTGLTSLRLEFHDGAAWLPAESRIF